MNVREFFQNQESGIAQANNNAWRRINWENRMWQQHSQHWDVERRAAALCGLSQIFRTVEALRRRPFDDLISRMESDARAFAPVTDPLAGSAIAKAASESMRIGETLRTVTDPLGRSAFAKAGSDSMRIGETIRTAIEPFSMFKTVLPSPNPALFSTVFDSTRDFKPLGDLQHQLGMLTTNSFGHAAQLGSTIADTFKTISDVVGLAHRPYVENPLFGGEFIGGRYADLDDLVVYGSRNFAHPDFGQLMEALVGELQGFRADCADRGDRADRAEARRAQIMLWLQIIGIVIALAALYQSYVSAHDQSKLLPTTEQQRPPQTKPGEDAVGPCP